jgi:hypothetical protein
VLPAGLLWVSLVPIGLVAALAFRLAPRQSSFASS